METYRIHDDASVYFVTYSVVSWLPVFVSERACQVVTDRLAFCHTHKGLRVNACVIMPTHSGRWCGAVGRPATAERRAS